jgi:hypothetical protein
MAPDRRSPRTTTTGRGGRNALDVARESFRLLVTGPDPLALDGARLPGLPRRRVPLDELRGLLLARSCPQATRDAAWTVLVTRSRAEGAAWTVGCVGVGLPALTRVTARLTARFAGDRADVPAAVLTGFLTGLAGVDLSRPRVMLRLRWAAYRAGHAALSEALHAPPPVPGRPGPLAPRPPWGHPDLVLARAVMEQVLTRDEAQLIGATRLEDVTVAEWAAVHEVGLWAVYKARERAELRLLAWLLDDDPAEQHPQEMWKSRRVWSKTAGRRGVQQRSQTPLRPVPSPIPEDPRCA